MKFLLNSFPKSGSQTFGHTIRRAIREIRDGNHEELAEYNDWVICQYDPVINLANFGPDVVQISVIRNPSDAITINTERHFKGFLGKQIKDIALVDKESDVLAGKTELTQFDKEFIDHQIQRYNSYLHCLNKNIDNIVCFTNEQTRKQTKVCIQNSLSFAKVDYEALPPGSFQTEIVDTIQYHPFSSVIRQYVESCDDFDSIYWEVMDKIRAKQSKYPVPFEDTNT